MKYVDKHGEEMKQVPIWLPAALHKLVKADRMNLSGFVRTQLEELYSDTATVESIHEKLRLSEAAKETRSRHLEKIAGEEDRKIRLRENVRRVKEDRISAKVAEQDEADRADAHARKLRDTWLVMVKKKKIIEGGLLRRLPENDHDLDHVEFWPALAQDISKLAGEPYSEQEVIAYAKLQVARV